MGVDEQGIWRGPLKMQKQPNLDRKGPDHAPGIWHIPGRNGSVLEVMMQMERLEGLTSASTCKSWTVKWIDGSKVELTVNSPALRNPKKPRQQAAHSMSCSEFWVPHAYYPAFLGSAVNGWHCGRVEPWWLLMPRRKRWSWRQFTKGSGKPWSMCKDHIAER